MKRFRIDKNGNADQFFSCLTECADYLTIDVDISLECYYIIDLIADVEMEADEFLSTFDNYENLENFDEFGND